MHGTLQGWAAKHGNDPSYLREVDIFISAFDTVRNKKGSQPMYDQCTFFSLSTKSRQRVLSSVRDSSLVLISISFERDQLSNILKTTTNASTAVSSNDGSKIVCSRSAAIRKSSTMRRPLSILVTISRTCTAAASYVFL